MSDPQSDGPQEAMPAATAADPDASTVGTGSVVAIGCTVATVLIILLGVVVYVILELLT